MPRIEEDSSGPSPPRRIDSLPVELHRDIIETLHLMLDNRIPFGLLDLSLCSKYWREQCVPMIFRDITLAVCAEPYHLSRFIKVNATNHGGFVRSVLLVICFDKTPASQSVSQARELATQLLASTPNLVHLFATIQKESQSGSVNTMALNTLFSSISTPTWEKLQSVVVTGLGGDVLLGTLLARAPNLNVAYLDRGVRDTFSTGWSLVGLHESTQEVQLTRLGVSVPQPTIDTGSHLQTLYLYGQQLSTIIPVLQSSRSKTLNNLILWVTRLEHWNLYPSPFDLPDLSNLSIILSDSFSSMEFRILLSYFTSAPLKCLCIRLRSFPVEDLEAFITRQGFPSLTDLQVIIGKDARELNQDGKRGGSLRQDLECARSRWKGCGIDLRTEIVYEVD